MNRSASAAKIATAAAAGGDKRNATAPVVENRVGGDGATGGRQRKEHGVGGRGDAPS